MSRDRERITVYQPKNLLEAKKLFEKFEQLELERLDKERFFYIFNKGAGELGFCIRHNTWEVCDTESNDLFIVTLADMESLYE